MTSGIEIRGLRFTYPGASEPVFQELDLSVQPGTFCALIGPSGCGKSTLLRLLAGLEQPDAGSILCGGSPVTGPGADRGVVFQSAPLFPWLTVRDNVVFALCKALRSLSRAEARQKAEEALCRVNLAEAMDLYPAQLSGGMAQRAAIARALAAGAPVLLLDEPFSALDPKNRMALQELLLRLWEDDHKTVLFVTHDMDEAIRLGDRVVFMEPGRIVSDDPVAFPRPRHREALLVSPPCCSLRRELISRFYQWGEHAEVCL